jgi:hypothetical protein
MSGQQIDVSDPAIQAAWKAVTDDKQDTNFMLTALVLNDADNASKLELIEQSSAGFHASVI